MRVARLSGNEAGSRLLILSSDQALQNVTLLRQQSAEIVFASSIPIPCRSRTFSGDPATMKATTILEALIALAGSLSALKLA